MSQVHVSPFQEALDRVEALSQEDQQVLIDLIQRRLMEQRRGEIVHHAETTLQAVREGRAYVGSIEDLKRDLLSDS